MSTKITITKEFLGILLMFGTLAACSGDPAGTTEPAANSAGAPANTLPAAAGKSAGPSTNSPSSVATGNAGSPGSTGVVTTRPPVETTSTTPTADVSMWCGVKRTLDSNCTACHNEQKTAGAPMSLKKYDDLIAPAVSDATKKVYQVVGVRVHDTVKPMPPQQKLTADQLTGIDQWVAAGAPAGSDPTCANAPVTKPTVAEETWPTNCDATYKLVAHGTGGDTTPYSVPAGQEIHPKISIPAPWGKETMQAIAFRSITDNPKVLHHWILYGSQREFLVGWAPGKQEISTMGQSDVGMNLSVRSHSICTTTICRARRLNLTTAASRSACSSPSTSARTPRPCTWASPNSRSTSPRTARTSTSRAHARSRAARPSHCSPRARTRTRKRGT
jgi:hypothetical protein